MNLGKVSRPASHLGSELYKTRDVLVLLEALVLDACLVHLDALNSNDALLRREEPRRRGRVGEEEPGDK